MAFGKQLLDALLDRADFNHAKKLFQPIAKGFTAGER